MEPSARSAAMGGAFTGTAGDVDSLFFNPGGLAFVRQREFSATHTEYLLDTGFDAAAYAQATSIGTFAAGFTRLGLGTQQGRDANRLHTADFSARPGSSAGGGASMLTLCTKSRT